MDHSTDLAVINILDRSEGGRLNVNLYNDIDPFACAWVTELIRAGHIPPGDVSNKSITELDPNEVSRYTQFHAFCGIAGWSHALNLAGVSAETRLWTGSAPCQPYSAAGKQRGNDDERNLWPAFFNLIKVCRPERIFGEQVEAAIRFGWLDGISADLEKENYTVGSIVLGAHSVGAPNIRQRLYWMADADCRQRYGITAGKRRQLNGTPAGRIEGDGEFKCGGPTERLADTDGGKPWHGRVQSGGEYGQLAENGATRGLVLSNGAGRNTGIDAAEATGHGHTVESAGPVCRLGHTHSARPQGRDERGHGGDERLVGAAGLAGRLEHAASDGRKQRRAEPNRRGITSGRRSGYWDAFDILYCTDGKARRIEPGALSMVNGASEGMDDLWNTCVREIESEIKIYAEQTKADTGEILRALRSEINQNEIQQQIGGSGRIPEAALLFAALCELQGKLGGIQHGATSGVGQVESASVREMREGESRRECASRSPLGREHAQQLTRKLKDVVRQLPQEISHWFFNGYPLIAGMRGRVGLLRGYGNAINAEVAAAFIQEAFSAIDPHPGRRDIAVLEDDQ